MNTIKSTSDQCGSLGERECVRVTEILERGRRHARLEGSREVKFSSL